MYVIGCVKQKSTWFKSRRCPFKQYVIHNKSTALSWVSLVVILYLMVKLYIVLLEASSSTADGYHRKEEERKCQ